MIRLTGHYLMPATAPVALSVILSLARIDVHATTMLNISQKHPSTQNGNAPTKGYHLNGPEATFSTI